MFVDGKSRKVVGRAVGYGMDGLLYWACIGIDVLLNMGWIFGWAMYVESKRLRVRKEISRPLFRLYDQFLRNDNAMSDTKSKKADQSLTWCFAQGHAFEKRICP